jgi:thiamine-phosphate pyrophosphorylase
MLAAENQNRRKCLLPRFYPILDTETAARRGVDVADAAREILEGGAEILQIRHKGFFSRAVFESMESVAGLCKTFGARFVVNDRADLAALLGAAVHLGQEDLPPSAIRRIVGPETLVGFSTHNQAQLLAAGGEPADYLALGPIFGTASKQNPDPVVGIEGLRRLRPLTARPLVAIGGITRANARDVLAAGADSVAVIGDLFPESGTLRQRVEEWMVLTTSKAR